MTDLAHKVYIKFSRDKWKRYDQAMVIYGWLAEHDVRMADDYCTSSDSCDGPTTYAYNFRSYDIALLFRMKFGGEM